MRIVQVITKVQRRGAEIFASQLAEELMKNGHSVLVVALYAGDAELPFSGELLVLNASKRSRFLDWNSWSVFAKKMEDFKPDLIQLNASDTLKFVVFSQLSFGWKSPLIYRNANQMGDFLTSFLKRNFNRFLISRLTAVISVSEASASDFRRNFKKPLPKVIPIGINPVSLELELNASVVQKSNRFIQIGGLVPEKDPLGMIDIFLKLSETHQDLRLYFVGSGPLEAALRAKINKSGLEEKVTCLPNQSNIIRILKESSILVMPSKIEGLPGVILEAMYCRIPVVAYGVGGIPEVLKNQTGDPASACDLTNQRTGWLVPSGDQEAFVEAIHEVMQLSELEKSLIMEAAFQLVIDHFTVEKISKQFEEYYNELLLLTRK